MMSQTADLFRAIVPTADIAVAGTDEAFEEVVTSQLFFMIDELRRRLADDTSADADAMRAVLLLFERGGLAPRDIADFNHGSTIDEEERRLLVNVINRAPAIRAMIS